MMFVSERNGSAFRIFKRNPNDCAFLRFRESHFHFLPKLSKVTIKNLKSSANRLDELGRARNFHSLANSLILKYFANDLIGRMVHLFSTDLLIYLILSLPT